MIGTRQRHFPGLHLRNVIGGQARVLEGQRYQGRDIREAFVQTITANASANTKGSYTEMASAAQRTYDSFGFQLVALSSTLTRDYLIDIALGEAGSEVVVLSNYLYTVGPTISNSFSELIPLFLPRSSRVSARCQASTGSNTVDLALTFLGLNQFPRIYRTCETYGADTSDSGGTSVDPGGTINTEGSWTQLAASTTRRVRALTVRYGNQRNTARIGDVSDRDIGIGGAGSEVEILTDLTTFCSSSSDVCLPDHHGPFPVDIPSSTRVACRAKSDLNDATDRLYDVVAYGYCP